MIEQEDNDGLTAAYLLGCHNTRKAYESRIKRYNHAVRREPYPMSRMYETAEGKYVQFEDYEALQQRLAAAEAKIPKWIPVSDSLPKECHAVLICKDGDETGYGYRLNNDWYEENELLAAYNITVTHWMPLPEPPNNEENAG